MFYFLLPKIVKPRAAFDSIEAREPAFLLSSHHRPSHSAFPETMFLLSFLRVEDTPDASPPLPRRARSEDGGLHLPMALLGFMSGEMGSHPREELLGFGGA